MEVEGGVEDVLSGIETGLIEWDGASVTGADATALGAAIDFPTTVAGDGYTRRERSFGRVTDSVGSVKTAASPWRSLRPVHDFPDVEGVDPTFSAFSGEIRDISATSGVDDPSVLGPLRPDRSAYMAMDGDVSSGWVSDPLRRPDRQALTVSIRRQPVGAAVVTTGLNPFLSDRVAELTATTDDGQRAVATVNPNDGTARFVFRGTPVDTLRLATSRVAGDPDFGSVAIQEVSIVGVTGARHLVLPVELSRRNSVVLSAVPPVNACLETTSGPSCDYANIRDAEEVEGPIRRISVGEPTELTVTGSVRARRGDAAAALLDGFGVPVVRASSSFGGDPLVSGRRATDGNAGSSWVADPSDLSPTLTIDFGQTRQVSGIRLLAPTHEASAPVAARIQGGSTVRQVRLTSGSATFEPIQTDRLEIYFGQRPGEKRPIGVGELGLEGVPGLTTPFGEGRTGALCGLGPPLIVDGVSRNTVVSGSLSDVLNGNDLDIRVCDGPVRLETGAHELAWAPSAAFYVRQAVLRPERSDAVQPSSTPRSVGVRQWSSNHRLVTVGAGAQAVLMVPENANPGWVAYLRGQRLQPQRIDGWQQGWIVPAGAGGEVRLEFAPDRPYRAGLLSGLLAAALLVGAGSFGLLVRRKPIRGTGPALPRHPRRPRVGSFLRLGVISLLALAGGIGIIIGSGATLVPVFRRRPRLVIGALMAAASALAVLPAMLGGAHGWMSTADLLAGSVVGYSAVVILRDGVR